MPSALQERWRELPPGVDDPWQKRVEGFRRTVVPWLDSVQPLHGLSILEVGSGAGASTVALTEQGAKVTGVDVEPDLIAQTGERLAAMGLEAHLETANAAAIGDLADRGPFDQVVFWAVLEHMTIDERLAALAAAWDLLSVGGLLTVVETPNRLWPFDSHTSNLPFVSWLPYELAYRYSSRSTRASFGDRYSNPPLEMDHYLRRGHGVSFHEFDLAIGDHLDLEVVSYLQRHTRRRNPVRRAGWAASRAGRTERVLAHLSPQSDRAWFQPFLYLAIRKR